MKKRALYFILSAAVLLAGCDGKKKEEVPPINIVTIDEIPALLETEGTIGDGTTMNMLEFVKEEGDTVYLDINSASVMGGVNVGDKVHVVYNTIGDDNIAQIAINLTALEHVWSQLAADGHEQSLELNSEGRASTYDMKVDYDKWNIEDGLLLLHAPKKVGEEKAAPVDTFQIMKLTEESLVLMHGVIASEFQRVN